MTCGGGQQTVTSKRTCTNPVPQYGGTSCAGSNTQVTSQTCNDQRCPIDGGWTDFAVENIAECSVTCGGGQQTITSRRMCTNPAPQYGGADCDGSATQATIRACNDQPCPIDGGWTDFAVQNISECSVTCGGGQQTVTSVRSCTQPAPQYGGQDCDGDATQYTQQTCNTNPCPIDGGWSDWENWQDYDECTVLCGSGTIDQWRMRTCTNPAPQYGGADCVGPSKENGTHACNTAKCEDKCPEGQSTYIANGNKTGRYYQCDNGVARRMECAAGTVWDQASISCVNDGSQKVPEVNLRQGDQCDPAQTYYAHSDCSKFIMCLGGVAYEMSCPGGLRFNVAITGCDFAANVNCP